MGFDEARLPRVVVKHSTQVKDLALDGLRLDRGLRPHRVEELTVSDELARVLDEMIEDAVFGGRQEDALILTRSAPSPQALVYRVEAERWELLHCGRPFTQNTIRMEWTRGG
jgi:hypothetical protein